MKLPSKAQIVTFAIIGLILANTFYLGIFTMNKYKSRYAIYYEPGYQFINFKEKLKNVKKAGYLTNKDISRRNNDGFYLQAQYFLAPTIFELNNLDNKISIVDFTKPTFMFYTVKKLNAKPIADTLYGQALIERRE